VLVFSQKGLVLDKVDNGSTSVMAGPFNNMICIYATTIFGLLILLKSKKTNGSIGWLKKIWPLLPFLFIEYFVTENTLKTTFWVPVSMFSQLLFFIYAVQRTYSKNEIFGSLYEACLIWGILEFVLTLLYPILGITQSTAWFFDYATEQSGRREGYASAVGTFGHPANLAFFCSFLSFFFFYSYLARYKSKISLRLLLACVLVVFFTYSRTSYILCIAGLLLIYYLYHNNGITIKIVVYSFVGMSFFYALSYVPIIHQIFFESNMNDMAEARIEHWLVALDLFIEKPILGWGINTDVYAMYLTFPYLPEFIKTNPIHNIHLIVLVETGIVGLAYWILGHIRIIIYSLKKLPLSDFYSKAGCILAIVGLLFEFVYGFTGWSFFGGVHTPCILLSLLLLGGHR